jgi:hypothetical protein
MGGFEFHFIAKCREDVSVKSEAISDEGDLYPRRSSTCVTIHARAIKRSGMLMIRL